MSHKVEAFNTGRWFDIGLRFATEVEARMYAENMHERGVTYSRVTPVDEPVNARWGGKRPAEYINEETK